jgi:uncharacterized Ntn-hydrolase superfamily protein
MILQILYNDFPGITRAEGLSIVKTVATYSIVAVDPKTQEAGVAVQSKFLAVGAVVPWVQAGVGAIATQAWANPGYGPDGLALLQKGYAPEQVIDALTGDDDGRERRQVGVVSVTGKAASFTGKACSAWAGHVVGDGFACQGNILANPAVVAEMAAKFTTAEGDLGQRLLDALDAAQAAGGDSRGMQSAALVVEKPGGGYGGFSDRFVDLRVDDHPKPLQELRRLFQIHRLYFYPSDPQRLIRLDECIVARLQDMLAHLDIYQGTVTGDLNLETREALEHFLHRENFEGRIQPEPWLDGEVYEYMLNRWGGEQETEVSG